MKFVFKIIVALALAYVSVVLSAVIGAFAAMFLGVTFHLNSQTINNIALYLPKLLLLIGAVITFVVYKRKRRPRQQVPETPPRQIFYDPPNDFGSKSWLTRQSEK